MNLRMRKPTTAALAVLALVAAGCGDDDNGDGGKAKAATPAPATSPATTPPEPGVTVPSDAGSKGTSANPAKALKISTDTGSKPKIPKPSGEAPTKLATYDVVKGKGKAVKSGDQITVQYVGATFSGGKEFDASWDRGQPFPLQIGVGMVIPGWDQGIVGMRKGGRRTLVIPSDLAYGPAGSPPAIGPNEPLVFVVDLKGIG
jgi:peptidylprolyl isomerase